MVKIPVQGKYRLGLLLAAPFLPILYWQGKKLKKNFIQLPEAQNPDGISGPNSPATLNILFLGESAIAGVGVEDHKDGFAGAFCRHLSSYMNLPINWKVRAKSGLTAKRSTALLRSLSDLKKFHLVIVGLGANDAFQLNSPSHWQVEISKLIGAIRSRDFKGPIVFAPLPPIKHFPAFTPVMKAIPGTLAEWLGVALSLQLEKEPNCFYPGPTFQMDLIAAQYGVHNLEDLFSDGVHPSKLGYQVLAEYLSDFILHQPDILQQLKTS